MTETVTDPFEGLLAGTELADKEPKNESIKWTGPIPASAVQYASAILTKDPAGNYTKKARVKLTDKETALQLTAAVRAAVEQQNPDVSVTGRLIHGTDGGLVALSLSVGERRGRKNGTA
jgi:hypothetical protein